MEAGELELRKVFEETIKRNVLTIQDYTKDTRDLVRGLEHEVNNLKQLIIGKNHEINQLKKQVSVLQQKLYNKGT